MRISDWSSDVCSSDLAIERQSSQGTPWERSKLVKEHAVPVAVINSFVQQALRATPSDPGKVEPPQCLAEEVVMFPPSVATLFQQDPQAWLVAKVVTQWPLHVWITPGAEIGRGAGRERG